MRTAIRQVMGTFAQVDRALLAKRLRDVREGKRAAGGHPSGSYPFGMTRSGCLDREQHVIAVIRDVSGQGRTLDKIASNLNSRPNQQLRRGARWTRQAVGRVAARQVTVR